PSLDPPCARDMRGPTCSCAAIVHGYRDAYFSPFRERPERAWCVMHGPTDGCNQEERVMTESQEIAATGTFDSHQQETEMVESTRSEADDAWNRIRGLD